MSPKKATSIRLPELLKKQAVEAGINISQLTEKALVEKLEHLTNTLPYSQQSYKAAVEVCKKFGLEAHIDLIKAIAIRIDTECKNTLEEH